VSRKACQLPPTPFVRIFPGDFATAGCKIAGSNGRVWAEPPLDSIRAHSARIFGSTERGLGWCFRLNRRIGQCDSIDLVREYFGPEVRGLWRRSFRDSPSCVSQDKSKWELNDNQTLRAFVRIAGYSAKWTGFVNTGRLIVSNPDARTKDLAHLLIK
jgi:hypothetical protein